MTRCTILCVHTIDGCKFPPFLDSSVELSKIRKARPLIFKIYWAPIYEVRARKNVSACCTGMTFPISGKSFPIPGLVEGYSWCGKRWLAMYKRSYVSSLLADKVFDASRRRLVQGPTPRAVQLHRQISGVYIKNAQILHTKTDTTAGFGVMH